MAFASRKTYITALAVLIGIGAAMLAVYVGMSDAGTININEKIDSTDQTNFAVPVNKSTQPTVPNGGLRPKTGPTPTAPGPTPVNMETSDDVDVPTPADDPGVGDGSAPAGETNTETDPNAENGGSEAVAQ